MSINKMFAPVTYKEGDSKDFVERSYIKTTGIYSVTLESIKAYVNKNQTSSNVIFSFVTSDGKVIQTDMNFMYTGKDGKLTDSIGSTFIQTLLRFKNPDKKSSSGLWTPTKFQHFGKEIDGQKMDLGPLKLQVYVTNVRSTYEKQNGEVVASEGLVITRLFNEDGLTQTELEAVKRGEDIEIKHLENAKAFLKKKVNDGVSLNRYSKIDEQEWLDIKGLASKGTSSKVASQDDELPDLDDDIDIDEVKDEVKEETKPEKAEKDTNTVPEDDFDIDEDDFGEL